MKYLASLTQRSSGLLARTLLFAVLLSLPACGPQATPTLFVPPTAALIVVASAVPQAAPSATSRPTASATLTALPSTPTPCSNDLLFVQDLTVPDGTTVMPGAPVDKQWLVTNGGTCDWNADYRLKLISGDALGAAPEQALYPARAGSQTTLRILFTAPLEAGNYRAAWQAFAPDGTAFGQPVFIQIDVSP